MDVAAIVKTIREYRYKMPPPEWEHSSRAPSMESSATLSNPHDREVAVAEKW
jgi:hypothetical protein